MENYNYLKIKDFLVRKVKIKDTWINYAQIGNGTSLILVHGWTNNWEGWIPIAGFLKKHFRLYILDLPGYGDSGQLPSYSLTIQAEYIALFIKKMKLESSYISGLSMGSLVIATLLHHHKKLIKKAVLISPMVQTGRNRYVVNFYYYFFKLIHNRKPWNNLFKAFIATKTWAYFAAKYVNMHIFDKVLIDKYGMVGKKKMTKRGFFDMEISTHGFQLSSTLHNSKLPILIVHGEFDKINTLEEIKNMLNNTHGNITYSSVQNSGHMVSLEQPKKTSKVIREFLQ